MNRPDEEIRSLERHTAQALRVIQSCKALFVGGLGQQVLRDLEAEFCERTSFNTDPLQMAFLEGQRHVILTIRHRCMAPIEEA